MNILGINAYHAHASAAIVCDGQLVAAVEEERFNRIKHCAGFPYQAVRYWLDVAGIKPEELTHIAVARDTRANLDKKLLYALKIPLMALRRLAPQGKFATIKEEVAKALDIAPENMAAEVAGVEHHKAHLPARSSSQASTRRRCYQLTVWEILPARCGASAETRR